MKKRNLLFTLLLSGAFLLPGTGCCRDMLELIDGKGNKRTYYVDKVFAYKEVKKLGDKLLTESAKKDTGESYNCEEVLSFFEIFLKSSLELKEGYGKKFYIDYIKKTFRLNDEGLVSEVKSDDDYVYFATIYYFYNEWAKEYCKEGKCDLCKKFDVFPVKTRSNPFSSATKFLGKKLKDLKYYLKWKFAPKLTLSVKDEDIKHNKDLFIEEYSGISVKKIPRRKQII
jgi:hypothetical protein